jgi:hypothetical protein
MASGGGGGGGGEDDDEDDFLGREWDNRKRLSRARLANNAKHHPLLQRGSGGLFVRRSFGAGGGAAVGFHAFSAAAPGAPSPFQTAPMRAIDEESGSEDSGDY